MIKFFHTADVHFGVENYGKIDQKTGLHSRFLDFIKSFEYVVDQAIKEKIDFFLFAGDAYKTAYPTPTQQKQFMRLLFKLQQVDIPTVIVVGNHDHPLSFGKTHALDLFSTVPLKGLHVFSKPDVLTIKTKNGPVQIVGIPWPLRHNLLTKKDHRLKDAAQITAYISEKVGQIIKSFADKLDPKIPAVLTGHLTVSSGLFSGSEKCAVFGSDPIFLPSQLAVQPFDYVALGHLHRHQNLNPNGYPAIVYSGSTERIDFGERNETKGFCLVSIDENKNENRCVYEFLHTPTRPMVQVEVKLVRGKDQTEQIVDKIGEHDIDNAIVKIVYHLDGDHQDGSSPDTVDLFALQRACAAAHCIASIKPVRAQVTRTRRAKLEVSMDFAQLLEKYLESKPELDSNLDNIKQKAFALYQELENQEIDEKTIIHKQPDQKERRV